MRDYMTALHDRFLVCGQRAGELATKVETAFDNLHGELSKEQQKLLLRFLDAENAFREEEKLDSFICGYRVADGIHREINADPPFSIVAEDEERARRIFELERGEYNGEAQSERRGQY